MKRWIVAGRPDDAQIEEITALLRSGGIVLMPTDTIYGLHAVVTDAAARKLARIKGRGEEKRFVTIAASIEQLESLAIEVPSVLKNVWPAPLTAILRRGATTIGVRIPDLQWLRHLLAQTGPLFSTSANRTGDSPIIKPDELSQQIVSRLDGIVDAGPGEGKASTIVDFTQAEPRFIREGDSAFAQLLRKTLLKKL